MTVESLEDPAEAGRRIGGRRAAVISVAPGRLARLLELAGPDTAVLVDPCVELAAPSLATTAGADRIAAVTGALPGPAVCVDAGTAVTVDVLDGEGVYRGGFIAAGPEATRAGLAARTAALPPGRGEVVELVPGLETGAALAAGAWGLCVGGVDRLVEASLQALGAAPGSAGRRVVPVLVTGGWGGAYLAASRWRGDERVPLVADTHLVHRGIRRWAERAWTSSGS